MFAFQRLKQLKVIQALLASRSGWARNELVPVADSSI